MPDPARRPGLPAPLLVAATLGLILLPLILAATGGIPPADALAEGAAAAGMAGAVVLCLQVVSSGRFETLSGRVGIDVTMAFHKWFGPVAVVLALAHVLLLAGLPDPADPMRWLNRLGALLSAPGLREGVWALGLLAATVVLALLRDRIGLRYELWRASHALGVLAVLILTVLHILDRGTYASEGMLRHFWPALAGAVTVPALWVYLRKLRDRARHGWRVESVRRVAEGIWDLRLVASTGRGLAFRAGQFAWMATGRGLPVFDNPFSIATAPGDGRRLGFLIQEAGDFTGTVGRLAPGTPVTLDAPHGSFTPDEAEGAGAVLLVAGGVGIAPILGILNEFAARGERRTVRLIYAARDGAALVDPALYAPACAALGIAPMLVVDRAPTGPDQRQGPVGRAHLAEALEGLEPARTAALVCGPTGFMTAVADGLHGLGVPVGNLAYERFDYRGGTVSARDRRILAVFRAIAAAVVLACVLFALR